MTNPSILITGATGTIGSELTKLLSQRGTAFRVMVRSPKDTQRFNELPGVEAIIGDFDSPDTMAHAMMGIERAFLLTSSSERTEAQQLSFVAEAKRAGVKHIVKLSQLAASVDSPVRFLRYHAVVEQAIQSAGLAFTFLRPNLFMQGLLGFRDSIATKGMFFAAVGDARISLIDIRDIAGVAAKALTESEHEGKSYTLTGPDALTHTEIAEKLSTALSHPVTFVDVTPDTMRDALIKAGFPAWQADGLIEDYAHYSRNEAGFISQTIQDVTGNAPRNFDTFAHDYASAFLSLSDPH